MTHGGGVATIGSGMSLLEEPLHRLSVEDVERMYESGVLTGEDRVELIDGVLYDVIILVTPEHSAAVAWLNRHLANAVGDGEVRVQDFLLIDRGFLSPDLIVLDEIRRDRQPDTARLAIEVSVSSLRRDLKKVGLYARAGVAEYWIAEVATRTLVVHRGPRGDVYASVTRHGDGEQVPAPLGAPPVDVSALFG